MRLPKINYANPYRMKRNMIIARKIPQRAVKVLASELTFSKEIALKKTPARGNDCSRSFNPKPAYCRDCSKN